MISLTKELAALVQEALSQLYPSLEGRDVEIVRSKDQSFGDYQCNSVMKVAREERISPREMAASLIEKMRQFPKYEVMIEKIEVAGPGFINIVLSPRFLAHRLLEAWDSGKIVNQFDHKKRVIIDFSSPNIAKEMHVGHLRSTIIGDCLSRVFEFLGADVLRLNHVGDWGTAFGMLIEHIKSQSDFSLARVKEYSLTNLMCLYKESKVRFDEDIHFKKQAQLEVVALQGGDEEALLIWKVICDISEEAYQEIYAILNIEIEVRGESFYNKMLKGVVEELDEKGLLSHSNGALCAFPEGFKNREGNPLPLMMRKSDGGYTYDTTDMAALSQRVREEKADRIIYVTDNGQATHFKMIFQTSIQAKIVDADRVRLDHVPFGLVLGGDGKKFKTRSGTTERLIDLLQAAVKKAEKILRDRNPDWEEYGPIAKILGIGAVKYADLSSNRVSDYCFSYDRMLRFEGNTAAFIMYSYVRSMSIQKKVGKEASGKTLSLSHSSEIALAKLICQFSETLDDVVETLLPNRLTEYLYAVAEGFNGFFRDCRVEGDEKEQERLLLVALTGKVLKRGLDLLGIEVPEKM